MWKQNYLVSQILTLASQVKPFAVYIHLQPKNPIFEMIIDIRRELKDIYASKNVNSKWVQILFPWYLYLWYLEISSRFPQCMVYCKDKDIHISIPSYYRGRVNCIIWRLHSHASIDHNLLINWFIWYGYMICIPSPNKQFHPACFDIP